MYIAEQFGEENVNAYFMFTSTWCKVSIFLLNRLNITLRIWKIHRKHPHGWSEPTVAPEMIYKIEMWLSSTPTMSVCKMVQQLVNTATIYWRVISLPICTVFWCYKNKNCEEGQDVNNFAIWISFITLSLCWLSTLANIMFFAAACGYAAEHVPYSVPALSIATLYTVANFFFGGGGGDKKKHWKHRYISMFSLKTSRFSKTSPNTTIFTGYVSELVWRSTIEMYTVCPDTQIFNSLVISAHLVQYYFLKSCFMSDFLERPLWYTTAELGMPSQGYLPAGPRHTAHD